MTKAHSQDALGVGFLLASEVLEMAVRGFEMAVRVMVQVVQIWFRAYWAVVPAFLGGFG